jgi:hypothetical protein
MLNLRIATVVCLLALMTQLGHPQGKRAKYALTKFNNEGCMAKGRVQDCSGSVVMRQIFPIGMSGTRAGRLNSFKLAVEVVEIYKVSPGESS